MLKRPIDLADRLDADHLHALLSLPADLFDLTDIAQARTRSAALFAQFPAPALPAGMVVSDCDLRTEDGSSIVVRLYVPADLTLPAPAVLNIHGGGLVMLSVDADDRRCIAVAERTKVIVVSVDYRLAPEHPYPVPLEDCWSALLWLYDTASSLGVDRDRIAVMGSSAGGGLAAALAMVARDRSGPSLCYQHLVFPMLDDRAIMASSQAIVDLRVWNRDANAQAWRAYLADCVGEVPPWAAPARAVDLGGLAPAYVCVGDLDLFVDEDVAYASALRDSGVPAELHVYAGAFHGSNGIVPGAALSRRWAADEMASLARHLA